MAFGADKLIIEIDGDTGPLAGTLGKVQDIGKKAFAGIAGAVGGASAAVGGLIKSAVQGYAEFEQLTGGVETLFKTSAGVVMDYANNAYKTAGVSANQYMETVTAFSASLLQSLGGDTAKAADVADMAILDMADNANKMGTAMESIQVAYQGFAKQNYTMLDNLKLGYGGNKAEMERLLADAEKLSGKKYDISNLNDVFEAIHVIQTELGITGTTALEAEKTISGSLNAAKAAWSNLVTGIADDNADFDQLINNFVESVGTAGENLIPRIHMAISGVGQLITGLLPMVAEQIPVALTNILPTLLDAGMQVVLTLLAGITDSLPMLTAQAPSILWALFYGIQEALPLIGSIVEQLIGTFSQGFMMYNALIFQLGITILTALLQGFAQDLPMIIDAAMELIESLTSTLIDNIPLLIGAALLIINGLVDGLIDNLPLLLDSALAIIVTLGENLVKNIPKLVDAALKIIDGIVGFLLDNLPMIIETGVKLLVALVQALPRIIRTIVDRLPEIITGIVNGLLDALPEMVQAGVDLFIALVDALPEIIETIVEKIPEIISGIVTAIWDNRYKLVDAGKDLLEGLWEGIKSLGDWLGKKVEGLLGGVIEDVKGMFGIKSPSKVFAGIGEFLMLGLAEGMESGIDDVLRTASDLTQEIKDQFAFDTVIGDAQASLTAGLSGSFSFPAYAEASGAQPTSEQRRSGSENITNTNILYLGEDIVYESVERTKRRIGPSMLSRSGA